MAWTKCGEKKEASKNARGVHHPSWWDVSLTRQSTRCDDDGRRNTKKWNNATGKSSGATDGTRLVCRRSDDNKEQQIIWVYDLTYGVFFVFHRLGNKRNYGREQKGKPSQCGWVCMYVATCICYRYLSPTLPCWLLECRCNKPTQSHLNQFYSPTGLVNNRFGSFLIRAITLILLLYIHFFHSTTFTPTWLPSFLCSIIS
jgi:hypothetical protein